jgi:glycosyltransferase involved in cell wall biosynthesis
MPRRPKKRVSAIILAHNEGHNLGHTLTEMGKLREAGLVHDVIVVNDGSSDSTVRVCREHGVDLVNHEKNLGRREGFISGVVRANKIGADVVVLLDADLERLPRTLVRNAIRHVAKGEHNMVTFKTMERSGSGYKTIERPSFAGQRVISMDALAPLIKRNGKWMKYLRGKNVPREIREEFEKHIAMMREPESVLRSGNDAVEIPDITKWGLTTALEILVPRKHPEMRYPIYNKRAYRGFDEDRRGRLIQEYAERFIRSIQDRRNIASRVPASS